MINSLILDLLLWSQQINSKGFSIRDILLHSEAYKWWKIWYIVFSLHIHSKYMRVMYFLVKVYIYIYSLIILSCQQHRYLWLFLTTSPYRSLLSARPQGYTPYPYRAAVCRFELVPLLLLGHVKGSIGVHHLWARPYFSSSDLHVWFVKFW